jgi:hypothetical protein
MEHQRSMLDFELVHHRRRGVGDEHARNHWQPPCIFIAAASTAAEAGAPF